MRLAIKIFIILTIFLAILLTGSYFYLRVHGKDLLVLSFNKQFHREIDFKEIHFSFPSTVRFRDVVIKGIGEAREVSLSLNLMGLFLQQVRISNLKIIDGNWRLVQEKGRIFQFASAPDQEKFDLERESKRADARSPLRVLIGKIKISGTQIHFYERAKDSQQEQFLFELRDVDLSLTKIAFPFNQPLKTKFDLTALMSGYDHKFKQDLVKAFGWFDFFSKDMSADLEIDGMGGQAVLVAHLACVDNDMQVHGQMNLAFQGDSEKEKPKSFEDFFIDALRSNQAHVELQFRFQTKMDDFQIGQVSLSGSLGKSIAEEKLPKK